MSCRVLPAMLFTCISLAKMSLAQASERPDSLRPSLPLLLLTHDHWLGSLVRDECVSDLFGLLALSRCLDP